MKILHIVSGDLNGGAARGAYWLHSGLKELNIDSKIFTNSKITLGDNSVVTINNSKKRKAINIIRGQLDNLFPLFYRKRKKIIFSSSFFGVDFTKTNEYKEADIVHLHWINGSFVNIKHLGKIEKSIVWTMRDMWPMTGGCHYAMECDKYKTGCGNCEQLNSHSSYDLSKFILNRKKKYLPKDMKIVGISHWLSDEAKKSELFKDYDVRTISNNIDSKEFFPVDKDIARKILGIKSSKKIILVGSTNLKDFYKGFDKYLEAIKQLDKEKYFLCFFGNVDKNVVSDLGFEYKSFGYLNDNISLRLIYSCANVFVAPSLMDAFGKTIAESMGCGTPVVCFDATGPKDIVTHKVDGYKVESFKSGDSVVVAKKYIELYEEILK